MSTDLFKTLVVIPAYNEEVSLEAVLKGLTREVDVDVLVVDDGSSDDTSRVCKEQGVRVVRHVLNTGLGAALETGLEVARRESYSVVVTFDGDGQHHPKDVEKITGRLERGFDVVIGVRVINRSEMPWIKRFGNKMLNLATKIFFGVQSSDSQSGLRGFNRKAIENINISSNRYEVSSEILYEAKKNNLKIGEVPVHVLYTSHSKRHATGIMDGLRIVWKMLTHGGGR